jgi:hypothetical protein
MMQRCYYPSHYGYSYYGGMGIEVDPRWHTFANFLEDMGDPPVDHWLERLDGKRNYWRGNCVWLPKHLQQRNRRNVYLITWRLRTMSIAEWARELGMNYSTLRQRLLDMGWPPERAFTTPIAT